MLASLTFGHRGLEKESSSTGRELSAGKENQGRLRGNCVQSTAQNTASW